MTLEEALRKIHAPKGVTSMIAGVMAGDFDPIREQNASGVALEEARNRLKKIKESQANCKSDWAFWGYEGDKAYWQATIFILEAAEITGPENLPEIEAPSGRGVVMDVCHQVEQFGVQMLKAAKATVEA